MTVVPGLPAARAAVHNALRISHRVEVRGDPVRPARTIVALLHTGRFRHGALLAVAALRWPTTFLGGEWLLGLPIVGYAFFAYGGVFVGPADQFGTALLDAGTDIQKWPHFGAK